MYFYVVLSNLKLYNFQISFLNSVQLTVRLCLCLALFNTVSFIFISARVVSKHYNYVHLQCLVLDAHVSRRAIVSPRLRRSNMYVRLQAYTTTIVSYLHGW